MCVCTGVGALGGAVQREEVREREDYCSRAALGSEKEGNLLDCMDHIH